MNLECNNLSKLYPSRNGEIAALDNVSFHVNEGEFLCIVGPSGCGKTTLLKIIAGLVQPTSGEINFNAPEQNEIPKRALVFQDHGLFPWMTVLENVAFGLKMQGVARKERITRSLDFIDRVGLSVFADNFAHELSIGMRQRVGIARAFVAGAPILLMDEPFGSLDAQTKLALQIELLKIWKEFQKIVIYVTHDIEEAIRLSDRILVMSSRPATICAEIPVPLDRPRKPSEEQDLTISKIKWEIWNMLKHDVRQSVGIER
jgi:NitT/TauT family transport system ATP-binding protein